eukprot:PLAT3634.1.p1 GENE.PLAT3634.1~~PLAT3634.1.p1  ORF type:complete len:369 (+),score=63.77 PLAT3634.1:106-1212(+)
MNDSAAHNVTSHNTTSTVYRDPALSTVALTLLIVQMVFGVFFFCYFSYLRFYAPHKPFKAGYLDWPAYLTDYSDDMKALLLRKLRSRLSDDEELLWHGFEDREAMKEDAAVRAAREKRENANRSRYTVFSLLCGFANIAVPLMLFYTGIGLAAPFPAILISLGGIAQLHTLEAFSHFCRSKRRVLADPNFVKTVYALTDRRAIICCYQHQADDWLNVMSTRYEHMAGLTVWNGQSIFYSYDGSAVLGQPRIDETIAGMPGGGRRTSVGFRFIPHELSRVEALLQEKMTVVGVPIRPLPAPSASAVPAPSAAGADERAGELAVVTHEEGDEYAADDAGGGGRSGKVVPLLPMTSSEEGPRVSLLSAAKL